MTTQSGKIFLFLLLLLVVLSVSSVYFLQGWGFKRQASTENEMTISDKSQVAMVSNGIAKNTTLTNMGIEAHFPEDSELRDFPAASFGSIKGVSGQEAFKLYYNKDIQHGDIDKQYSGLTIFFISYPNTNKIPLENFLPTIKEDDRNHTNTIEDVMLGQFKGFKHTQCCYSGGVEEFYFLNNDASKLILMKVYNYGPEHDFYNEKMSEIIDSIRADR